MAEEHGGEEGLLEDAKTDKDAADERKALQDYLALIQQEVDTDSKLKTEHGALMAKVAAKYGQLTEDEIKTLVVDDKWIDTLAAAVQGELDRVSQALTGRIRELAERYASPLPQITGEVAALASRMDEHLKKMGVSWNNARLQTDQRGNDPGGMERCNSHFDMLHEEWRSDHVQTYR